MTQIATHNVDRDARFKSSSRVCVTQRVHPDLRTEPGVNHAGPAHRRHHAALVIGADSRQQFDDILKSTEVAAVIDRQERHITAAHAYTVDRTVPGIRMKP